MFYLESGSSDTEDADAMQNLLRQEDERGECGERTREKKLRHRMRRLTMSSRNVFSEKYATLLKRIEPKIPENATQSLSSIFGGGGIGAVGIGGSVKRYRKSRYSLNKRTQPLTIVRSVSNNEGAGPPMSQLALPRMPDYQENSHSAPDLEVNMRQEEVYHRKFEYSTDSTESMSLIEPYATGRQRRITASSDSDDYENESLQIEEETLQDNWIKPGETRSCENSQLDLTPKRSTLLEDLKSFSRRLGQLMHLTPKPRRPVSKRSLLFANATPEHKSYYCSQPELPTCQADDWISPNLHASTSMLQLNHLPSYESAPIRRSTSLSRFASLRCLKTELDIDAVATGLMAETPQPHLYPTPAPALCICPSTPTPTEHEHISQLSRAFVSYDPPRFELDLPVNISNSTNHCNNNISSLLAPCYSVSPSTIQNQQQQLRPSRSSSDLQQQQQQQPQQLQQQQPQQQQQSQSPAPQGVLIPTTIATLESNANSKRFASPIGIDGNRLKLTPSPSKSGISGGANADSASTSTTSTATTMVPAKEVGEICRRSSDSDLSVTPKGMLIRPVCIASDNNICIYKSKIYLLF